MQLPEYLSFAGPGSDLIVVKRSKFIGHAAPAESEAEAMEFIAKISDEHKTATHNVWAYQIGDRNQGSATATMGSPAGPREFPPWKC